MAHDVEIQLLNKRIDDLKTEMCERFDKQEESTKALVEAWKAATGLVKFIKFLAALGTAMGVVYGLMHQFFWGH